MASKALEAAPEQHTYDYETEGACELLRLAAAARPRAFTDAKRSATCQLLGDLVALFGGYGYQTARRADREWGHVWTLTFFRESLCLAVAEDGGVHAWLQPHQGRTKHCGLDVDLIFDPALLRWMGPWRAVPVGEVPQADRQRVGALEELTRGVLAVVRHQVHQ